MASLPVFEIKASSGRIPLRLSDLWIYRELLYFLVWRDVKIRYKQTALGAAWALIQPLANMIVFSLFFGRLGKMPSDGIPYPLFCLAGLVPWMFFVNGLTLASNSLVGNAGLIRKVYFPRLNHPDLDRPVGPGRSGHLVLPHARHDAVLPCRADLAYPLSARVCPADLHSLRWESVSGFLP